MTQLVLDADIAIGWCFLDAADGYTDGVLEALKEVTAVVPAHWMLEVSNVLLAAQKRSRLTEAEATRFVELLHRLPIETDGETPQRAADTIRSLGRNHGLSAYEAAYLELSIRRGAPLATRNPALQSAARRAGATLVGG